MTDFLTTNTRITETGFQKPDDKKTSKKRNQHNRSSRSNKHHSSNRKKRNNNLKVCTLSGTDEFGRNCTFIEYGNEIIIIDAGFSFPEQELYGIDYLIPNIDYLKKNKKKIKAILITHGHLDHTGALPYLLPELEFPPVYAGRFANALIEKRLQEFKLEKKANLKDIHRNLEFNLGNFKITFIGVTHSIPNAFSIYVKTPKGNVFFSGDYKIDENPANEKETDYSSLKNLRGEIDLALMESTNAAVEGRVKSEKVIGNNLYKLIKEAKGRVVVASFSSMVSRLYMVMRIAQETHRKIVVLGRSLRTTMQIAREQGYVDVPDNLFITEKEISKYPDHEILALATGSQGERYGALNLISLGEHKYFKIKSGDLFIMSSSDIPGNEYQIGQMTDRLIKKGGDIIKNEMEDVHASGHGKKLDMKIMMDLIRPKNIIPIHGNLTKRYQNMQNLIEWGYPKERVYLTADGYVWEFNGNHWKKNKEISAKPILIDGLGVGDIGEVVLRDRRILADFGMVTVILNLSHKNKKLIGKPKIVSRGFVYMKASKDLIAELQNLVRQTYQTWYNEYSSKKRFDYGALSDAVEKKLSKFIYKKTKREPMILPVIM